MKWLSENHQSKFFLMLHTYRVHCPYEPEPLGAKKYTGWYRGTLDPVKKCSPFYNEAKLSDDDRQYIRDLYGAQVNQVDQWFSKLIRHLKDLGIYDSTMIVFLSDHGESLGEHGYYGHNLITREQLWIPLILRIPGQKTIRIERPLESIDVMPTIFDVLGLKNSYPFQGRSIYRDLDRSGAGASRVRFAEQYGRIAVQKEELLLVKSWDKPLSLYNIRKDPLQENDLLQSESVAYHSVAAKLLTEYDRLNERSQRISSLFIMGKVTPFDPESLEQLKAFGYLQ